MSHPEQEPTIDQRAGAVIPAPAVPPVVTERQRGTTTVSETAIARVIGVAVRQVPGVHALGSSAARTFGQLREAVGQADHAQGISVETGERQVAVTVTLVAGYPWPLQDIARNVRAAVYDAVEGLIGKDVAEVNVTITDVDVPALDRTPAGPAHSEPKERRLS
ncbi:Asp23/Gls24 family envelope stress response protein [Tersicoccus phoenicis]|uniref:Asp23/Gls24 family envelope stress response protein n=1 Tax=Tersicoccus phoenicis TaxID=554083 RepID=UPI001F19EC18|nr:Asp23/Gls24 family envelope stress response protein [Tersicoccus phoenicis]